MSINALLPAETIQGLIISHMNEDALYHAIIFVALSLGFDHDAGLQHTGRGGAGSIHY